MGFFIWGASDFNDKVSSFVILSGIWAFAYDSGFMRPCSPILGPGLYSSVEDFDIKNDEMTSLNSLEGATPTGFGEQLGGQIILFDNSHVSGDHRHVFVAEPNLADNDFNDRVCSFFIYSENWAFYRDSGYKGEYHNQLGPGLYPLVEDVDIDNDMSSLQPVTVGSGSSGLSTADLVTPTLISPADGQHFSVPLSGPFTTTLRWQPVSGATGYHVDVEFLDPPGPVTPTSKWNPWRHLDVIGTSLTFEFTGARPGRWRVKAVDQTGAHQNSQTSAWSHFDYTIPV